MSTDDFELAQDTFEQGKAAFERGLYQQAIASLEKAIGFAGRNSPLGGEAQIWLVNAYQAAGKNLEAIALCEVLGSHPDLKTRKQSRRMIYILKAPKLKLKEEWMTKIPDLSKLDDAEGKKTKGASGSYAPPPKRPVRPKPPPEPVDLSQVETKDNGFVWLALGAIGLVVLGLVLVR
jgi:tetratricopeptide (TPR) repeat protein